MFPSVHLRSTYRNQTKGRFPIRVWTKTGRQANHLRHSEGIGIDSACECMAKKRLPVVKDHPRLIIVNATRDARTTFFSPRASFHAYLFCKSSASFASVTTSKSGVSSIVLSWPKRRAAAPTNAKASVAANCRRRLPRRYAVPTAAISRNNRQATQTPLASLSGADFSPSAVLTLTRPSSTAHDPPIVRPSSAVVIFFQIIG